MNHHLALPAILGFACLVLSKERSYLHRIVSHCSSSRQAFPLPAFLTDGRRTIIRQRFRTETAVAPGPSARSAGQAIRRYQRHSLPKQDMHSSSRRTVLITGGNRGLGRCLVQRFKQNWNVLATARRPEALPVGCQAFRLDLARRSDLEDLAADVDGPIDVVIHNAGFHPADVREAHPRYYESTARIASFSAANVAEVCLINALRPMELTGLLLPHLSHKAIIIGVSSWLGSTTEARLPGQYGYDGSKALLNHCLKALDLEFQHDPRADRCALAVNPGWMKTDMGGGERADVRPQDVAERLAEWVEDGTLRQHRGEFVNLSDGSLHPW